MLLHEYTEKIQKYSDTNLLKIKKNEVYNMVPPCAVTEIPFQSVAHRRLPACGKAYIRSTDRCLNILLMCTTALLRAVCARI